ncbi:MAG: hypothetical protein QXV22_01045 [Thermoplasmataceae archaeon]
MKLKIDLLSMNHDLAFQVKLQVSLMKNAQRIMAHYSEKEKFERYIQERIEKITSLLSINDQEFEIYEGNIRLYP